MTTERDAESQETIDSLNGELTDWSFIYDELRSTPAFPFLAQILWERAIERIYEQQMPRDAKFIIEITDLAGERIQNRYPQCVEMTEGRFFLSVDPPLNVPINDPRQEGRIELIRTGVDLLHSYYNFGLMSYSGSTTSVDSEVLFNEELIDFQIK